MDIVNGPLATDTINQAQRVRDLGQKTKRRRRRKRRLLEALMRK